MTIVNLSEDLRQEMEELLGQIETSLTTVIRETDTRIALPPDARAALADLGEPLPESGSGAMEAMERLLDLSTAAGANTAGPKCFHFVIGGSTPAARQWWGEQHGVDLSETGLAGVPQMPVLTSGLVHASTLKVLALQGIGRANLQRFSADERGRLDMGEMRQALHDLDGKPAVVIVNAGEVNAGEFDPVNDMPFRYNPGGLGEEQLDELNQRLGEAVLADGRFLVGTSKLGPRTVFRPAFSNWRTRRADVEEFAAVVQELGQKLVVGSPAG